MKNGNLELFEKKYPKAYGGELRKKAKNRGFRPLVTKNGSMHLVLRSSKAIKEWSFLHKNNKEKLAQFIKNFSRQKGVEILSVANVGNHLHLHIRIPSRILYKQWVRGLTSGIAMMIAGLEGLKKLSTQGKKFWDYRPFTRLVQSYRHFLNMKDYLQINQLEGSGMGRLFAVQLVKYVKGFS